MDALHSKAFPRKLFHLLSHTSPDIVSWMPDGQSFRVKDETEFSSKVLPLYFAHSKLTSFKRQLNIYGFRCFTKGLETGAYYHPCFKHGQSELLDGIQREPVKSKAGGKRARANTNNDDDRATHTDAMGCAASGTAPRMITTTSNATTPWTSSTTTAAAVTTTAAAASTRCSSTPPACATGQSRRQHIATTTLPHLTHPQSPKHLLYLNC